MFFLFALRSPHSPTYQIHKAVLMVHYDQKLAVPLDDISVTKIFCFCVSELI